MVRKGVRTLMQQVAQIEREKDDYKAQLCTAKKQLQENAEQHNRSENKISKLQQTLRSVQEDKANTEAKLTQKESTLANTEDALKQKIAEASNLRDKVTSLELQLGTGSEERGQCEVYKRNRDLIKMIFDDVKKFFHRTDWKNVVNMVLDWNQKNDIYKKNWLVVRAELRNWTCKG